MSTSKASTITAIVLLLAAQASAFSLSNFTPKIQNLPSACNAAYTAPISNCDQSDFGPNNDCSKECIEGLIQTSNSVNAACKDVDVSETSVIGVFLIGQGIQALCNVQVATISSKTSARASATTSAPARQQTQTEETSTSTSSTDNSDDDSTSSTSSSSTPSTTESTTTSTTPTPSSTRSLIVDPSPSSMAFSPIRPTARPSQTSRPGSQEANADSGGGSPFDAQTGSASSSRTQGLWSLVLGTVAVGFGMAWI